MARGINIAESVQKSINNYTFASKEKPVVFLSHKSEDKDFVESIGEYLMKSGIDIYLDKRDFKLQSAVASDNAEEITECIQEGIAKSDYILCFVSRNTVKSWWVPYEIGYGKKANKEIATLVRDDVTYVPSYLEIEETIKSIEEINGYIKRITSKNSIPLQEQSWYEKETLNEHIVKADKYHSLAKYLNING
ncbi:toll/interleukin-1 receptor domain-containing protein [Clostridium botulinum]|uniref:toll/interleukin-1 receptor domain-containing protein n=1 Tax=Clostridium botulinum TaxID=1491 RepID=UPI0019680839|nr:toll/interleukin-1 receptor domain-containing protein [Clostridium botulinum]MBN1064161.1 toll/interleukin-1 receptor domain-containing protein [Clostridium botulinum]